MRLTCDDCGGEHFGFSIVSPTSYELICLSCGLRFRLSNVGILEVVR